MVVDRLEASVNLTAWGVQGWNRYVGNGTDAWGDSDWGVEEWRHTVTTKVTYWLDPMFGLYSEYYTPVDRHNWNGHGQESNYYWLVGFRGRLN